MPVTPLAHTCAWLGELVIVLALICAMSSGFMLAARAMAAARTHANCALAWCETFPASVQ